MRNPHRKVVFIDRDGVINVDLWKYVESWKEFRFEKGALEALKVRLQQIVGPAQAQAQALNASLATPFVPASQTQRAQAGVQAQLAALEMRLKDCERLEALCH